jgi:hypothetical protein
MGMKMQYPAMSRIGANVSPPIAKSMYPNTITTKATAHQTTARQRRGPAGAFRGDAAESRSGTQ